MFLDLDCSDSLWKYDPSMTSSPAELVVPKTVFVVPYRNRIQQKFFFEKYMAFLLEDRAPGECEIYFSHQSDKRTFNRGAVKNIGFLAVKQRYPHDYQDINFVFNDVDTIPFHKLFDYETTPGFVKHYYGFKTALGGIVVIKGGDFEMVNGYPNFWGWGNEDTCLQKRCLHFGIQIDREVFYPIGSPQILQLFDGVSRIISKRDFSKVKTDRGVDGIRTLYQLRYSVDAESINPADNVFVFKESSVLSTFVINITHFLTSVPYEHEEYYDYDLREPVSKIIQPDPHRKTHPYRLHNTPDDWKQIPYVPTAAERKQQPHLHGGHVTPAYLYSPQYAKQNGIRPRASTSVGIKLGGSKHRYR